MALLKPEHRVYEIFPLSFPIFFPFEAYFLFIHTQRLASLARVLLPTFVARIWARHMLVTAQRNMSLQEQPVQTMKVLPNWTWWTTSRQWQQFIAKNGRRQWKLNMRKWSGTMSSDHNRQSQRCSRKCKANGFCMGDEEETKKWRSSSSTSATKL